MNIPEFNAEASLYQTGQTYRGYGGSDQKVAVVVPADCTGDCYGLYGACLLGAVFNPAAEAGCFIGFLYCTQQCPPNRTHRRRRRWTATTPSCVQRDPLPPRHDLLQL
jgi:hypothetical protein